MSRKTKIVKTENKNALTKADDINEEMERWRKKFSSPDLDESDALEKFCKLSKINSLSKEQEEERKSLGKEVILALGLNNGVLLQSIARNFTYGRTLARIRQDLIKEYKCQTTSELMLVDRIVSAYWRGIRYETYLGLLFETEPNTFSYNEIKLKTAKELYKGIELANRQFESGLTFLKNSKQPSLNIRVNADNAYLAQNQQVINNKEESLKPNDLGDFYEVAN